MYVRKEDSTIQSVTLLKLFQHGGNLLTDVSQFIKLSRKEMPATLY